MNKKQRAECMREPGINYTAAEDARMVELLNAIAIARLTGLPETARALSEEVCAAAVASGHSAVGKTLMVTVQSNMAGELYAIVGPRRGEA